MTEVYCSVQLCKHNYNEKCIKDIIQVKEKDIESQSICWSEKVCEDYTED